MAVLYVGAPEEGEEVVQPLKELRPDLDHIQPMPYTDFQAMLDPFAPQGVRSYWRGAYMSGLPDEAIDTFLQHAPALTAAAAPFSQMFIFRIGQASLRCPRTRPPSPAIRPPNRHSQIS
jgi:hypothetical protein